MAKYKVGDKVRVRSDLKLGKHYLMEDEETGDSFVKPMDNLLGKVVTIKEITDRQKYRIEEMGFNWTDKMFEGLAEEPEFHVYDTVKHEKYGIGTVIDITFSDNEIILVEFDEWNEDFPNYKNEFPVFKDRLTLIQSYSPN